MLSNFGLSGFLVFIFCWLHGARCNLYLQPSKSEHGYFTDDSFFITCITTDVGSTGELKWLGTDENEITATEGRIHIQSAVGQQGLELVVESVQKEDAGKYVCSGDDQSESFDLIVYHAISFGGTPEHQHAPEGENAYIECNVKADPKPVVSWYFNGSTLTTDERHKIDANGVKLFGVRRTDAGIYKCKALVTTHLASQMNEMDIHFHVQYKPEFLNDSESIVYASMGAVANLNCTVSADPFPMFQWIRNGETMHNSSDFMIFNNETRSVAQLTVTDPSKFGEYICQASNVLGSERKVIVLEEGDTPDVPDLKVVSEGKGTLTLGLELEEDDVKDELRVTGFKVQYILASESWDQANSQEFSKDEHPYVLSNMSYNTEYLLRAAARNAAGYSAYSNAISYMTQALQVSPVVSDTAVTFTTSLLVTVLGTCILWVFY